MAIDVERLLAEALTKHGIRLDPHDPAIVLVTLNRLVLEDAAEFQRHDIYALWPSLHQPVLLLRAARELLPGAGFVVSSADAGRFAVQVPLATVVEVEANHYGIVTADATALEIGAFLRQ